MEAEQNQVSFFKRFSKQFWIINSLELIERGAYYSLMAILAQHMVQNLDFSETLTGIVAALFMFCLYFLPVILGAIADKVGFKQMLILNFILMLIGYSMFGFVSGTGLFILAIVILGVGAGGFKPIISSSIAHITTPEKRNLAFSIYYWMINCGAFVFPLTWGLYFAQYNAIVAAQYFHYVFYFSAFFVVVNMIITFTLYKNPKEPETEKRVKTVFANMVIIVKDFKFFSLLLIYSGFWFMFAMNHTFLPLYMLNFHIMPGWFTPLLLATINPGTIIVLGPYLSRYADRYPSLQLMIIGIIIFMIGLLILGFFPTPLGLFSGIIVFSIGEFLTHPSFISYTSKIAPKDKVTIYMGYIFIATGIGLVLGSLFGGPLYENIARNMESPKLFWAIVVCVGLVSTFFFIFYNKAYTEKKPEPDVGLVEEKGIFSFKRNILDMKFTMVLPILCIPILLVIAQSAGTLTFYELKSEEEKEIEYELWDFEFTDMTSGHTNENSATDFPLTIEYEKLIEVSCTLTWTDEGSSFFRGTNEPDEFKVSIIAPNDEVIAESNFNSAESVSATATLPDFNEEDFVQNYIGSWIIQVEAGDCGDDHGPLGVRSTADTGNDWSLEYSYKYKEEVETETN